MERSKKEERREKMKEKTLQLDVMALLMSQTFLVFNLIYLITHF
jgi:hypothetical protein